jgi:hypothetical protein
MAAGDMVGADRGEIAWVAQWAAPHDGDHRVFAERDDVVLVGREPESAIRLGAAPVFDERVPRRWLELSWHRGAVMVENLSEASIDLAVYDADGDTIIERQTVPARFRGASASPNFAVLLDVPALPHTKATSWQILIRTSPAARPTNLVYGGSDLVETVVPPPLSAREKELGRALTRPLLDGHSARAPLDGIVRVTGVSRATVQRTISDLDLRFLLAGMAVPASGDQYDRVAYVLRRHQRLLR